MIKDIPLILLAGGRGTRLGRLTEHTNKSMVEVAGKPFIAHQLELIKKNGINRVVIYISFSEGCFGEHIIDFVKDGSQFGLYVAYIEGEYELLNGGAIRKCLSRIGNHDFFVMYNDSYIEVDLENLYRKFKCPYSYELSIEAVMTVCKPKGVYFSNVEMGDWLIVDYDKEFITTNMKYIDYGVSIFSHNAFRDFKQKKSFDLMEVWHNLIFRYALAGYVVDKNVYEIGSLRGLTTTEGYIRNEVQSRGYSAAD